MKKNNISIVWDFDGTLIPSDSTSLTVNSLSGQENYEQVFWEQIKALTSLDDSQGHWEHILASHAPAWMYSLSKIASSKRVPLNKQFFKEFVAPKVEFYPSALKLMRSIKSLAETEEFKEQDINIHHFIVSAGLKDLIECCFESEPDLVTWVFGCVYKVVYVDPEYKDQPESVPIFCMDETMKTRSLFEIVKGSFIQAERAVNVKVQKNEEWSPFENMIYVGDGPTDIPALSLTRSKGGAGIVLYNETAKKEDVKKRLKQLSIDQRADLITPANFSSKGELYQFLENRCRTILKKYQAKNFINQF